MALSVEHEQQPELLAETPSYYFDRYRLPNEWTEIDTDAQLFDAATFAERTGINAPLTGVVQAGDTVFFIADTRGHETYATPYILVEEQTNALKGIWPGVDLTVGRDHVKDRFTYADNMSRTHFTLSVNKDDVNRLAVKDEGSMNGTFFTGNLQGERKADLIAEQPRATEANYTVNANEIFKKMAEFGFASPDAPYGYMQNHPVIGRRSRTVIGGVYGTGASELLLVDDKSRLVQETVDDALYRTRLFADKAPRSQRDILQFIESQTASVLQYDLDATDRISRPHYKNSGIIGLSEYIQQGVGVCRHQAILNALLIEKAVDAHMLARGKIGVERNVDVELNGGHAWAVYESAGQEYIIDSAHHFTGTRDQAVKANRWRYIVN